MNYLYKDGIYNLKIHYLWTFFSSFLFLSPILTLYYHYYWLSIHQILVLSSLYFIFSALFEIPTSLLGDSFPRRYVLRLSVLCSLGAFIIYAFFPSEFNFYFAVLFSALWTSLWSWVWHSKLQEDLEAAGLENEFWKIIWHLIALQNVWKLLTPIGIYFVLKYFSNWYHILAILDVLTWIIATFFVFKFKPVKDVNYLKWKSLYEMIKYQWKVLKNSFNFIFLNKKFRQFLLVVILTTDFWYLWKIIFPDLVISGIKDYLTSFIVWFSTLAWILWNLIQSKIAKRFWYINAFKWIIFLNFCLYFLCFTFYDNNVILSSLFVLISFTIWMRYPVRNHIFMENTNIQEKATVRSLFMMFLSVLSGIFLFVSSFIPVPIILGILSMMMLIWFLVLTYLI